MNEKINFIRLTKRDKEIIEFVKEFKLVDTNTLSKIFFNGSVRASQIRLKNLVENRYLKCYRENVTSPNLYYVNKKPTQVVHSLILSRFIGELYGAGINIVKYKVPFKIGNIIADCLLSVEYNGINKLFFLEVENTKTLDNKKYLELYKNNVCEKVLSCTPKVIVITNKKVKLDEVLKNYVVTVKTDFSDLENFLLEL